MDLAQVAAIFFSATCVVTVVLAIDRLRRDRRLDQMLDEIQEHGGDASQRPMRINIIEWLGPLIRVLGTVSTTPRSGKEADVLREQLAQAGFFNESAYSVYRASTTGLLLLLGAAAALIGWLKGFDQLDPLDWMLLVGLPLLGSMRVPALVVGRLSENRVTRIEEGLPELVDLLMICIEGGQSFDSALSRSAREMARHNTTLASELDRLNSRIRTGATRSEALREFATRNALDDVRELVTMLIQADRFGVTLRESLQNHAEFMRIKRLQRAEERANKLPVKMMAPLMFCLLPALLIILFGPAMMMLENIFNR